MQSQGETEVTVCAGVVTTDSDGLAKRSDALLELPLCGQRDAKGIVNIGEVRLDPNCVTTQGDRLLPLPLAAEGVGEVVKGVGEVGLQPDRWRGNSAIA